MDFFQEGWIASFVMTSNHMTSFHREWGKECRWDEGHDPHPGRGVKAQARERHLTQGSCEAGVGTEEAADSWVGWSFSGTSWWSEGSSFPKAAGTIQTNWSLLAASVQAPHLNRPPSLRLTPLRGFSTCEYWPSLTWSNKSRSPSKFFPQGRKILPTG